MKREIQWHEECLRNQQSHLKRERDELERKMASVSRTQEEVYAYARQILHAKEAGITEFDRERYMKPRKRSSAASHAEKKEG